MNKLKEVFADVKNNNKWKSLPFSEKMRCMKKVFNILTLYSKYGLDEKFNAIDSEWVLARINERGFSRLAKLEIAEDFVMREIAEKNLIDLKAEKEKITNLWDGKKELEYSL